MRLVLVLVAVIGLVATLWFALASDPAGSALEPATVAPRARVERAQDPLPPLELVDAPRTAGDAGATAPTRSSPARPDGTIADIAIVVTCREGPAPGEVTTVECRDSLARPLPLTDEDGGRRHAGQVAPGEYVVTVLSRKHLVSIERITVLPVREVQVFEIALRRETTIRVRWQADDGRPFLDAVRVGGVLPEGASLRIAVDDAARAVGDSASHHPRTAWRTELRSEAGDASAGSRDRAAGLAPDVVCDLALPESRPAFVTATIDSVVVGSLLVDDTAGEVVFRTPLDLARKLRATVRFCLVDAESESPVANARFSADKALKLMRGAVDIAPDGCHVDSRLTAGRWMLEFEARGYATLRREVELAPGADLDLGSVRLEKPGEVVAHAVFPDGSPAPAVRVALLPVERFTWGERTTSATDSAGNVSFSMLPREPYVLVVEDARYASRSTVVEPHPRDARTVVELRVEAGTEVALDFGFQTATTTRAFVHDGSGHPICAPWVPLSGVLPLRLLPGEYVVELDGAGEARAITVTDESVVFDVR